MPARALRVMQSFGTPRSTSNPYVHMLDEALAAEPGLEHLRFDRRQALFGRFDAIQFHWPEALMGGSTPSRSLARRLFFAALLAKLALTRTAIVRTAHNVGLPDGIGGAERRMLQWVEDHTDLRILLNKNTPVPPGAATAVIPHGDYRVWFADAPTPSAEPNTLGFVGLVRRYKGVDALLDAFAATRDELPDTTLRICGNPTSADSRRAVERRAADDPRITTDLRYLSEDDFAHAVRSVSGVVLPYRFMHNSGTVLAALSLGRPVLVPRTETNEALADEVGAGWIHMFDGDLHADDLIAFAHATATQPAAEPDLSARTWDHTGRDHLEAFRRAVAHRRGRRRG